PEDGRPERIELAPQVADVEVDDVAVSLEVVAPDAVEDLGQAQDAARVLEEQAQEAVLGLGEVDEDAGPADLVGLVVELDVGETERRLVDRRARPPKHGPN